MQALQKHRFFRRFPKSFRPFCAESLLCVETHIRLSQEGFRPSSKWLSTAESCNTHTYSSAYLVEFRAAFDSVDREGLEGNACRRGVTSKLVLLIKLYRAGTKAHIRVVKSLVHSNLSLEFNKGLSSVLFNCAVDWVMQRS